MARAHNPGRIPKHFVYRHWNAKIAILKEGPSPLLQCTDCVINISLTRLENHKQTDRCYRVTDMWLQWRDVYLAQISGDMKFSLCGR